MQSVPNPNFSWSFAHCCCLNPRWLHRFAAGISTISMLLVNSHHFCSLNPNVFHSFAAFANEFHLFSYGFSPKSPIFVAELPHILWVNFNAITADAADRATLGRPTTATRGRLITSGLLRFWAISSADGWEK